MGSRKKCCVGGCNTTGDDASLFQLPRNDQQRNLWMSFLVPTNSSLLVLTKEQLITRVVCEKHFERRHLDLDAAGKRHALSYPSLMTEAEVARGEPLPSTRDESNILEQHNYCKKEPEGNNGSGVVILKSGGDFHEHSYSQAAQTATDNTVTSMETVVDLQSVQQHKDVQKDISKKSVGEPKSSYRNEVNQESPSNTIAPEHPSSVTSKKVTSMETVVDLQSVQQHKDVQKDISKKSVGEPKSSYRNEVIQESPSNTIAPEHPSSVTSKKVLGLKKYSQKKRKFIKHCTKIATESLGLTGSQRVEEAQKIMENQKYFQNFDALNKQAQSFLIMQLKNCRKNKMARRFTLEEKLMALLMLKQSPKEYKLLEHMFALPNKRTLSRLSEKITIEPGLNPQIFQYIKNKTQNWDDKKKLCTIVFDEVSLTPHVSYNEKDDQILGFIDMAGEKQQKFCDHALVFMIRGVCSSWRQSVAYYFCEGTVPAPTLQNILKQIVRQIEETGLTPLGLVCDQGSTFRTAIKAFRAETIRSRNLQNIRDDGSVSISGCNLNVFFDPPHLLKGIRNNFVNKNIIWEDGKKGTWKDIEFIYDLDSKLGHTRALPKLTAQHVDPEKIKKMKVSVAAQVMSARTAAMLKYTNALNSLHTGRESTMATTADVVEFFDNLFDSVNGHPGGAKKGKLRKAVKINSEHVPFWTQAIRKLKIIKFEDSQSKVALQLGRPRIVRVPSLDGWITTLESFIRISKTLFENYGVEYYYPRNINQDPLENFFGRVRALNYRNVNPNATTFSYAFKSLLLTNILSPHSRFANCEVDNGDIIIDIGFLFDEKRFSEKDENKENEPDFEIPSTSQGQPQLSRSDVLMEKIKVQCSAYTAGFLCRKLNKYIRCRNCLKTYTSSSFDSIHTYIQCREYTNLKGNNLVYPNEKSLRTYRHISQIVHSFLNLYSHKSNISKQLTRKVLRTIEFSWLGCLNHKIALRNYLIKSNINLQVHNWCNTINRILKGGIEERHVSTVEQIKKKALAKYKTYILRRKVLS